MNVYEQIGKEFLTCLNGLVKNDNMKTREAFFKVLNHVRLKAGYSFWLYLAKEQGMGDQSALYTYPGDKCPFETEEPILPVSTIGNFRRLFKGLEIDPSPMGAWQAYLLYLSETQLPVFWHGGYIKRTYFFDREHFQGIKPLYGDTPVNIDIKEIPEPSVTFEGGKYVIYYPYWNDWTRILKK